MKKLLKEIIDYIEKEIIDYIENDMVFSSIVYVHTFAVVCYLFYVQLILLKQYI